jgi:NADH dehydrogenase (ubiquinone) 1 alpha subcomplex subunit 4
VGLGCAGAFFYTVRLAVRSPEVSWNKKSNPEPWNEYTNKQHKVKDNCHISSL